MNAPGMGLVTGIAVYVIVWWLVLFMVLPFGVERADRVEAGHEPGAPAQPRLWLKIAVTTGIAALVWLAIELVVRSGVISFRDMAA